MPDWDETGFESPVPDTDQADFEALVPDTGQADFESPVPDIVQADFESFAPDCDQLELRFRREPVQPVFASPKVRVSSEATEGPFHSDSEKNNEFKKKTPKISKDEPNLLLTHNLNAWFVQ